MEVLVVIAIFGILVMITGYVYASALSRSRDQQRMSDLETISNGLEQFYLDNKSYPAYGDNTNDLFLAKFQLEPYSTCQITAGHKYLVPTYMASIPEDPQRKFTLQGSGANCDDPNDQDRQYVYIPVISAEGESAKDFQLAAWVERPNNVSTTNPTTQLGYYRQLVSDAGILFCTNTVNPSCTHNRFLGPKKNN